MRILHYFLGFPPYRSGGLTKYAMDLMSEQSKDNNFVMALWPGQMYWFRKKSKIKKRASVNGIENYELINPLPISLDEGIADVEAFTCSCDTEIYKLFLESVQPDVIHIHTLMGLHKEFIETANDLKIRTVFTTHDYFGICPKVTLYHGGSVCNGDESCRDCVQCNSNALSINKIRLMQSPMYRMLKETSIVKKYRTKHRSAFFDTDENTEVSRTDVVDTSKQYIKLREYYQEMFEKMDLIHFNSTISEKVYRKYFTPKNSIVMTISHKDITDNRDVIKWNPGSKLRITCLAPAKPFKGFNIIKSALDELWDAEKRDFVLYMFGPVQTPSPYMIVRENGFLHTELESIFSNTDVLVAPSIWYETFGFTVLEAISYGVPVIVSENVGAKDVVGDGGIIIKAGSVEEFKNAITEMTVEKQCELRARIQAQNEIKTWKAFVRENYQLYDECLNIKA